LHDRILFHTQILSAENKCCEGRECGLLQCAIS